MIEELLAEFGREVGLGIVEKRGDVVLQSAFAAALIVDKVRLAVAQQNVARLKIAVKKIIVRGSEQKLGEAIEVVFEGLFAEGNTSEAKKIVFEIVQIPSYGLAVEAGAGIANGIVQIAGGFHLEAREDGDNFAVGLDDCRGDGFAGAIFHQEFEKRGVAKIFFEVGAVIQIFGIDFGNRETVTAKVPGEFEEGDVFFAPAIEN